MNLKKFETEPD